MLQFISQDENGFLNVFHVIAIMVCPACRFSG